MKNTNMSKKSVPWRPRPQESPGRFFLNLPENTMKKEYYYFDNVNDKNNYIVHDFDYAHLNDFKYEINTFFCSFAGFLKESNTLSIMNRNYFC